MVYVNEAYWYSVNVICQYWVNVLYVNIDGITVVASWRGTTNTINVNDLNAWKSHGSTHKRTTSPSFKIPTILTDTLVAYHSIRYRWKGLRFFSRKKYIYIFTRKDTQTDRRCRAVFDRTFIVPLSPCCSHRRTDRTLRILLLARGIFRNLHGTFVHVASSSSIVTTLKVENARTERFPRKFGNHIRLRRVTASGG